MLHPQLPRQRAEKRVYDGEVKIGENMVYAIVESGGKQYRAVENGAIEVDRLPVESGQSITLEKVLLVADDDKAQVGAPYLAGISVDATVVGHVKGPKLIIFKYEPKKRIRRKTGHRQEYTRLMVHSINYDGKAAKNAEAEKPVEKVTKPKKASAKPVTKASVEPTAKASVKPDVKSPAKKTAKSTAENAG